MSLWTASYVALWFVVTACVGAIIVLYRQLGLLHLRFGPRGPFALDEGPPIGTEAPAFEADDFEGRHHVVGLGGVATTLVFVSPGCAPCHALIPALNALGRTRRNDEQLLVITISSTESAMDYVRQLKHVPAIAGIDISTMYGVSSTPYAVQVERNGRVSAKGAVNTVEQLEILMDLGRHWDREGSTNGRSNLREEVHSP